MRRMHLGDVHHLISDFISASAKPTDLSRNHERLPEAMHLSVINEF